MNRRRFQIVSLLALVAAVSGVAAHSQTQQPDYQNTQLTAEARAHDLVGRMTLDEKASQLEDWAPAIPRLGAVVPVVRTVFAVS